MQLFRNIQSEIIARITDSTASLKIAVTWFTNDDLFEAILKKLESPGYEVSLIVLNDRINNKKEGIDFQKLINQNGVFYYSDPENMVHHKFCVIDSKIVITGSYNWTYYAENRNWENVVILNDPEIVNGYIEEFNRIMQAHQKVESISAMRKLHVSINSNDYLETDYFYQAKAEINRGHDLTAAKIYTEILKLNSKQTNVLYARNEIVKKYNGEQLEVCPFEIGILYLNGYSMAIPAFASLPFTVIKGGRTTSNTATSLRITIQKNDYITKTILQFSLDNIKPCPEGTEKVEHTLTLNKNGILTVVCRELNGYNRNKTMTVDIRNWF